LSVRLLIRVTFPLLLVVPRLRRRPERVALVGGGIAAGAVVLAVVLAGSLITEDRSLAAAMSALSASERAVQVKWFGALGTGEGDWRSLDRIVVPELERVGCRNSVGGEVRRGGAAIASAAPSAGGCLCSFRRCTSSCAGC
jgi:hypothetical protein